MTIEAVPERTLERTERMSKLVAFRALAPCAPRKLNTVAPTQNGVSLPGGGRKGKPTSQRVLITQKRPYQTDAGLREDGGVIHKEKKSTSKSTKCLEKEVLSRLGRKRYGERGGKLKLVKKKTRETRRLAEVKG